jgi:hypothetical protein
MRSAVDRSHLETHCVPTASGTEAEEASASSAAESESPQSPPAYDEDAFIQALPEDPARCAVFSCLAQGVTTHLAEHSYRIWDLTTQTPTRALIGDETMCRLYNAKCFGVQVRCCLSCRLLG